MTTRRRLVLVGASVLPLFLVAISLALFLPYESWMIIAFACGAGLVSAVVVWHMTHVENALHQITGEIQQSLLLDQESATALIDPLTTLKQRAPGHVVVNGMLEVCNRLVQRRETLRTNVKAITIANLQLAQGQQAELALKAMPGPDEEDAEQLRSGFSDLSKMVRQARQRGEALASLLRDHPEATIVMDRQYKVITLNKAAESLFGYSSSVLQKRAVNHLFAHPNELEHETFESPMMELKEGLGELHLKQAQRVAVVIKDSKNHCHAALLTAQFGSFIILAITPRDRIIEVERKVRELHRRSTVLQLATLLQSEVAQPIEQAQTAIKVLVQATKKLPQREILGEQLIVARRNILQPLNFATLLSWLVKIENKSLSSQETEEIRLLELTEAVGQRVEPYLASTESSLRISDHGTWLLADESRIEVILLGMLHHAAKSWKQGQLRINLHRAEADGELMVRIEIGYDSTPLDTRFATDLVDPFGRLETVLLDDNQSGSLLGLYVAKSVLQVMGGLLTIESPGKENCKITAILPSRPCQEDRIGYDLRDHLQHMTVGDFRFAGPELPETDVEVLSQNGQLCSETLFSDDSLISHAEKETTAHALDGTLGDWKLGE